jgi:heptosyltransferase-2
MTNVKRDARIVVLVPNWLGDAVMSLFALGDVRQEFDVATLAVAARPSIAPLFEMVSGVDEVVRLGAGRSASVSNADALARGRFDVAILFPNSFGSAWLTARAGIPERWGYRADWRARWLTRVVPRPRGGHQVAYYRDLVRALGVGPARDPLPIDVSEQARHAASERLRSLGWDGASRLVGIAPGAAYGTAKQWPPEYFAALIADLHERDGATAVLLGTAADAGTGRAIGFALRQACPEHAVRPSTSSGRTARRRAQGERKSDSVREGHSTSVRPEPVEGRAVSVTTINLMGQTDLPSLAATLTCCDAFVSNDSGAMHLAAALGVPVTAIFGSTNERETAPRGRRDRPAPRVVVHEVFCRPCMLRECPIDHRCMRQIDPARVAQTCRDTIGGAARM